MDAAKVGAAIKTLRLHAGYTQHDLAEVLCVTDQAVSKWERGLSVPDVSIVTNLSILLNVDVDNLLEGNITYLEKNWQGLLILETCKDIFSGSEVYGKPMVYFYLSYFMLAGIGDIYIDCHERDRRWIIENIGDGSCYGIQLKYVRPVETKNTMVIYNNPFVYGTNLTKYFQRAMSRSNGITVLTVTKKIGKDENRISFDRDKAVRNMVDGCTIQYRTPIVFFPAKYFDQVYHVKKTERLSPLYAEPMGNGMIEYSITDTDSLWDTSSFLRYLKIRMGKDIYDLKEIARNRNFIR